MLTKREAFVLYNVVTLMSPITRQPITLEKIHDKLKNESLLNHKVNEVYQWNSVESKYVLLDDLRRLVTLGLVEYSGALSFTPTLQGIGLNKLFKVKLHDMHIVNGEDS